MNTFNCASCGTANNQNAQFCSGCNRKFGSQPLPLQQNQVKKNSGNAKIVLIILGVILGSCVLLGILGAILDKSSPQENKETAATTTPPTSTNQAPDKSVEPPKDIVSNIKWTDYDNIYNIKSNSTDMQKDALWKTFEGKTVTWQGTVNEVSKGMMGGLTLSIKMNEETLTGDISLDLKKDQENKAMSLTKGNEITFTGKLKNYGGAVLPLTMDEGVIK